MMILVGDYFRVPWLVNHCIVGLIAKNVSLSYISEAAFLLLILVRVRVESVVLLLLEYFLLF